VAEKRFKNKLIPTAMTIEQLNTLNNKDIVYVVINTGSYGIGKYQYIGIHTDHKDKPEDNHVFLSEHFLSTVCLLKEHSKNSRNLKRIFLTLNEAIDYQESLRAQERSERDY